MLQISNIQSYLICVYKGLYYKQYLTKVLWDTIVYIYCIHNTRDLNLKDCFYECKTYYLGHTATTPLAVFRMFTEYVSGLAKKAMFQTDRLTDFEMHM